MRKIVFTLIKMSMGLTLVILLGLCSYKIINKNNNNNVIIEGTTISINNTVLSDKYYTPEDFNNIIIGKSPIDDLPDEDYLKNSTCIATSFGGICTYPMENGGWIQVSLDLQEMTVIGIKIVDPPTDTGK